MNEHNNKRYIRDQAIKMTDHPNKNFLYQNWRQSKNTNQRHHKDERSTVSIISSVGPYKNTFGDFVM